jgi:serine/threonine protein kinase
LANAYEAKDSIGNRVFLKAYISPTPAVDWYKAYIAYVNKLNQQIARSTASTYCEQAIDTFEAKVGHSKFATLFQVYEFVDGGHDLESILKQAETTPERLKWSQRVSMAKVMLACLKQLHEARIVHCDLKPANIIMESVEAAIGYRPKLIDMDSSILADTEAAWHGKGVGYVGSPNYYSPEHIKGGSIKPLPASDVYTSALILYDLLGQGNPYRSDDQGDYNKKALAGSPETIRLKGRVRNPDDEVALADLLKRALAPEPSDRPAMREIHQCLLGINIDETPRSPTKAPSLPSPRPPAAPPPPTTKEMDPVPAPPSSPSSAGRLDLESDRGSMNFGVTTQVGKRLLDRISTQGIFASEPQFELISRPPEWLLKPITSAKNSTAINDKIVLKEQRLSEGDRICLIGSSGKRAMELKVTFK